MPVHWAPESCCSAETPVGSNDSADSSSIRLRMLRSLVPHEMPYISQGLADTEQPLWEICTLSVAGQVGHPHHLRYTGC